MAIKDVVIMGQKSLYERSKEVAEFGASYLLDLIQDMKDTMQEKGGVGIAAPQIGCNLRVVIFGFEYSARYPNEKPVPQTILINPEIEILTDETIVRWEGCLSVPGVRGRVARSTKIRYQGFDPYGKRVERLAEGFHARMVQHECDHLDGVLFMQRLDHPQEVGFESVLKDHMQNNLTIL